MIQYFYFISFFKLNVQHWIRYLNTIHDKELVHQVINETMEDSQNIPNALLMVASLKDQSYFLELLESHQHEAIKASVSIENPSKEIIEYVKTSLNYKENWRDFH